MSGRILVGMLATDENEREQAIAALRAQTHPDYEFFLIENQPNKAAHEALYSRFMAAAARFDVFLKLDADMVLTRDTALAEVAGYFAANPDVGLLTFELIDWYSDTLIPGMVITRNTARWPVHDDQLLVDSSVSVTGRHVTVSDRRAALAVHSPDPSPLQAFRFGVHRAMKAIQDDRPPERREAWKAQNQWDILNATWANFVARRDARLGLAVAGAEMVLRDGSASAGRNYTGPRVRDRFERDYATATAEALLAELAPVWNAREANDARWRAWCEAPAR
jgi:hypothetical protein